MVVKTCIIWSIVNEKSHQQRYLCGTMEQLNNEYIRW